MIIILKRRVDHVAHLLLRKGRRGNTFRFCLAKTDPQFVVGIPDRHSENFRGDQNKQKGSCNSYWHSEVALFPEWGGPPFLLKNDRRSDNLLVSKPPYDSTRECPFVQSLFFERIFLKI